jgi:hypothetical protein
MFQGDFLTKITLRCHHSHLWREGNLHPGPNGAYGDSEGCHRHPGIRRPQKNTPRPEGAHGIAVLANTPPCALSGRE